MKNHIKKHKKLYAVILCMVTLLCCLYIFLLYTTNPFISKWRTIYIETAMTTNTHQWLATAFIPKSIIDEVMADRAAQEELQKELESSWNIYVPDKITENSEASETTESSESTESTSEELEPTEEELFFEKYWELDTTSFKKYIEENPELIKDGYKNIVIEDLDENLNIKTTNKDKLLVLDVPNNTMIIKVTGDGYVGRLVVVKNTDQVCIESASTLGQKGEAASVFAKRYDAEVVINASGFKDNGGHGNGGIVKGSYVLDGVEYGKQENKHWKFVGIKKDNRLYISSRKNTDISDYRWGIEFYPALIVDGENVVDGSYCMGIQPRTVIGQSKEGDILMLVVDGRQVGYSLGCTVADCRDVLFAYNAYQGMNLDGGSSSVLYYKGKLINKPSSVGGVGRYMPNAIVVKKQN